MPIRENKTPIGIMKPKTFTTAEKSAVSHPKGIFWNTCPS